MTQMRRTRRALQSAPASVFLTLLQLARVRCNVLTQTIQG